MTEVFQDQRLGVAGEAFEVVRKGFFAKDGEEVNFFLKPVKRADVYHHDRPWGCGVCYSLARDSQLPTLPQRVDEQMAVAAKTHHQYIPGLRIVPVSIETYEEDSSCGIELVAKTSTGCILGGSALGAPQISPVDAGVRNYWKLWSVWDVWIQIFR